MVFNYYQLFLKSLKWGSVESIGYETLLLIHEIFLCKIIGLHAYGIVGILFAAVYLMARLLNFGLDLSFAPFFAHAIESKHNFKKIVINQLLLQLALFLATPILLWYILPSSWSSYLFPRDAVYNNVLLLVSWLAMVAEGMQRAIKHVLYLAFDNKKIAIIEVSKISLYIGMVWLMYGMGYSLTSFTLITMFLFSSVFAVYFCYYALVNIYTSLPNNPENTLPTGITKRIIHARFYTFLNQTTAQLYSSNFAIPMITAIGGVNQAGMLKLISSISYYITELIKKTFGTSSIAVFSHNKHTALEHKQELFGKITRLLFYVLTTICIFIILYHKQCVLYFSPECASTNWTAAYIFLIIHFSEYFLLTYKKFFIAHEQMRHLMMLEFIDLSLIILSLQLWRIYSAEVVIAAIIFSRILTMALFISYSYYYWSIHPLKVSAKKSQ